MREVGINGSLAQSAATAVPFGGTKRSGIGREPGRAGMDQSAGINSYGILYEATLSRYPAWASPGTLWGAIRAQAARCVTPASGGAHEHRGPRCELARRAAVPGNRQ